MAYSSANLLGVNLAQIFTPGTTLYPYSNTDPPLAVGQQTSGTGDSLWVYVLALENLGQYDAVAIDENFVASQATDTEADDSWKFGVAAAVAIPAASYGWVQCRGATTCLLYTSDAADERSSVDL